MNNKGIFETSFIKIIFFILTVGIILFIWNFLEGQYWVVTSDFEKMQTLRRAANLGYVIAGSVDALAYSDGTFIYSRILDSSKLENIKSIPSKYYYPGYAYKISIRDLETGKEWKAGYGIISKERYLPLSALEMMPTVSVFIPVNIIYPTVSASVPGISYNDVKIGVMEIEISKE